MLHLIPAPFHRWLYRVAYRLRRRWRRFVRRPIEGVTVIALDADGKVLLVRHSYGSGRWTLPGGGLDRGEDPLACANREMREELGCGLTGVALFDVVDGFVDRSPNRGHVFVGRIEGTPRPDQREVIEAGWFAFDALPAEMVAASRHEAERYRQSHP